MLDRYLIFVPALDKVVESAHVLFDEVTQVTRKTDELLVVDPARREKRDFYWLVNMAYRDDENGILFVTTRVAVNRGFIVAYRAPVVDGRMGKEETTPIHAKDVERMVQKHWEVATPLMWQHNTLTRVCDVVVQGAPASDARTDHPRGLLEPAAAAQNPVVGVPTGSHVSPTAAVSGKKPRNVQQEEPDSGAAVPEEPPVSEYRRSHRQRTVRTPVNASTLGDVTAERAFYIATEALADESDDADPVWDAAKVKELESQVLEHDTYDVVQLPPDRKAINSKWVVKRKPDKLKARFTPKGCAQLPNIDYKETWAPVAKLVTLRVFLTIVAILGLFTCQLDLKTAFLNASLEEEIFCKPLHDHVHILILLYNALTDGQKKSCIAAQIRALRRGGVLKLKKAVYGLKQAPRQWWKKLHEFLRSLGFVPNQSDICLYVLHLTGGAFVLLLLYVDDIILAGTTEELVNRYASMISKTFRVSSEGPLHTYLGFDIDVQLEKKQVQLCMDKYMEKVFRRFKLEPKQSVVTPLPESIMAAVELAEPASEVFIDDFEYRAKVGCILYYMICMRPDICFAVGFLARYCNKVNKVAAAGVTQLLQYCYNTRKQSLILGGSSAYLCCYVDADWAGDRVDRCSTGCYILFVGMGPVEWGSRKHKLPAQSTAEAEYIAMNAPARAILWLRWLLHQIGVRSLITEYSSTLFTDSTAAQSIAANPVQSERTKHIAIKYHFIRSLVQGGVISLEHVDTLLNVADIGTKVLGKRQFLPLSVIAMGHGELVRPTKRCRTEQSDEFV